MKRHTQFIFVEACSSHWAKSSGEHARITDECFLRVLRSLQSSGKSTLLQITMLQKNICFHIYTTPPPLHHCYCTAHHTQGALGMGNNLFAECVGMHLDFSNSRRQGQHTAATNCEICVRYMFRYMYTCIIHMNVCTWVYISIYICIYIYICMYIYVFVYAYP